jgi:hypothetical protein
VQTRSARSGMLGRQMRPASLLLERLIAARRRGENFDAAWTDAVAATLLSVSPAERTEWAGVLGSTVDSWRASWERRPPRRPELALTLVADSSDREPLPERPCAYCGQEIPAGRGRRGGPARYCGDACRRAAYDGRARVAS